MSDHEMVTSAESGSVRPDLLALSEEALIALSNRGLVKRARRDLAADRAPSLSIEADGTVVGRTDEVETTLAPGVPLIDTACSCGAAGVCRHRLGVVLTFQAQAGASSTEPRAESGSAAGPGSGPVERWSPGAFTDDDLVTRIGTQALARARRSERRGVVAVVQRPTDSIPEPTVRLPTATVRFLVPHSLAYATTDAVAGSADENIALAVWAFRSADDRDGEADQVEVVLGGDLTLDHTVMTVLRDAVDLADTVLLNGVVNVDRTFDGRIERVRRGLERAGLRWPLGALEELADQLVWYRDRSARYRTARVAELLAELHARHRASTNPSVVAVRQILGSDAGGETELRHLRLIGLGARVTGTADEQHLDVYLAHPEAGTVLVMQRDRSYGPAGTKRIQSPPTSADQAGRTFAAGVSLERFALGTIATESAIRRPDHEVRIVAGRLAQSTVATADLRTWESLPESLVVSDLEALSTELADRPPALIGRRVLAENFRVFVAGSIKSVAYRPGLQRLDAVFTDSVGNRALVSREHRTLTVGAIGALERVLGGGSSPRMFSGTVRATADGLVIDPVAVATDEGLISLDLVEDSARTGSIVENVGPHVRPDPRTTVLANALELLVDAAQRGLRHSSVGFVGRLHDVADDLAGSGLSNTAGEVRACAAAIDAAAVGSATSGDVTSAAAVMERRAAAAWVNAVVRIGMLQLA